MPKLQLVGNDACGLDAINDGSSVYIFLSYQKVLCKSWLTKARIGNRKNMWVPLVITMICGRLWFGLYKKSNTKQYEKS